MWDNKSLQQDFEWGNVKLPGMSDEELLDPNLNRSLSAKERTKNTNWQQKQEAAGHRFQPGESYVRNLKTNDPKAYNLWLERHKKITKEVGQRESFRKKSSENSRKAWEGEKKEQRKQALKEGWAKPGARERKSQSVRQVYEKRPELLDKLKETAKKNGIKTSRPVVTPEGLFMNKMEWARHCGFNHALFGYRQKKNPELYQFITQEEYIILTGTNPFC